MPAHDPQPDAELARAAQSGDRAAFVEIVARYQALVCGTTYGVLNDFGAAEDAAQDAFLSAWRKIGDLREPGRLRPWLVQIARNAALGKLRGRRDLDSLDSQPLAPDGAPLPDETAASNDESDLVSAHLAELPEKFRLPLVLFYREGKSVRAVAEALEISEDAAKQRLVRARTQLRESLEGVIESTLARNTPSAVFTMAIAAAIGLLKAPSAIAATAFASTATATAGGAATPVITTMTTSQATLIPAVLVAAACLPLGFVAHLELHPKSEAPTPAPPAEVAGQTPENPFERWPNSTLLAEWRQLHEIHGTAPEAMPLIFESIQAIPDAFRRRALRAAILAEWGQLDPAGGFAFFSDGDHRAFVPQILDEWLKSDASSAVDALLAEPKGWANLARTRLEKIANLAPERFAEIVVKLPPAKSNRNGKVTDGFAAFARSNSVSEAQQIASMLEGKNRAEALAGIAQGWSEIDPDAATEWVHSLPEGTERDEVLRHVMFGLAGSSPDRALEMIDQVPSGEREGWFATSTGARVLRIAGKENFDETLDWLAAHPDRFGYRDLEGLVREVTKRLNQDPTGFLEKYKERGSLEAIMPAIGNALLNDSSGNAAVIWDWASGQPTSNGIEELLHSSARQIAEQDPLRALELVSNREDEKLKESVASSIFANGRSARPGGRTSRRSAGEHARSPPRPSI